MPFRIRLSEPANSRYMYVDPVTNTVHLLTPLTTGTSIALDNTCKTVLALQEFFGKKADSSIKRDSALHSLTRYKAALEADIALLDAGDIKAKKIDRLEQINRYIQTLANIEADASLNCLSGGFPNFPEPILTLIGRQTNLHSMVLRPAVQDNYLRTPAPLFTMNRIRAAGTFFHNAQQIFGTIKAPMAAAAAAAPAADQLPLKIAKLAETVAASMKLPTSLGTIVTEGAQALSDKHKALFGTMFDYTFSPPIYELIRIADQATVKNLDYWKKILKGHSAYVLCGDVLFFLKAPAYVGPKKIGLSEDILPQIGGLFPAAQNVLKYAKHSDLAQISALTNHTPPHPIMDLGIFSAMSMDDLEIESNEDLIAELTSLIENRLAGNLEFAFPVVESLFNILPFPIEVNKLNIMTQFLLAQINFSAYDAGKTKADFGKLLDSDEALAKELAQLVKRTIESKGQVEEAICVFINTHKKKFQLTKELTSAEINNITKVFTKNYQLVKDSPHMDEFLVLNLEKSGQFFNHQGSICFDFSDLSTTSLKNRFVSNFAARPLEQIRNMPTQVPAGDDKAAHLGFITMEDKLFHQTLKSAIRQKDVTLTRRFLLSMLEDGRNVFEALGRDYFKEYDNHPETSALFVDIRRSIFDAETSRLFNRVVRGFDAQLLLTPEMVNQLYVAVVSNYSLKEGQLQPHTTTAAINEMLSILKKSNIIVNPGDNGTFILDTTAENVQALQQLTDQYVNQLHLTQSMCISLYKQVEEQYGKDSPEAMELKTLNNINAGPQKLLKTFSLLDLNVHLESFFYTKSEKNGFILKNMTPEILQRIQNIHQLQANRFKLTREMAGKLYAKAKALNPELSHTLDTLQNTDRPDRLEATLALLGIPYDRVEFNDMDGYWIYLSELEQQKIRHLVGDNPGFKIHDLPYRPLPAPVLKGGGRGFLYDQILQRAQANPQPAAVQRERGDDALPMRGMRGAGGAGIPQVNADNPRRGRGREEPQETWWGSAVPPSSASPAPEERRRMHQPAQEAQAASAAPMTERQRAAMASASPPPQAAPAAPVQRHITVRKVKAFDLSPPQIHPISLENVHLNCPAHILQAFQNRLRGTAILGTSFDNPYTNNRERFPTDANRLTARHLQIMARNEFYNTTGVMATALYAGLLSDDNIAAIRCLVKATTVASVAYATKMGGLPNTMQSPIIEFNPQQKIIMVDQSGFQWQLDHRNTGGLFFYPNAMISPAYDQWQTQMYQSMYGIARPNNSGAKTLTVTWNGVKGTLDLNGVALGIEKEFVQALDAVVDQQQFLDANEVINFKFLKAGMGFFANGLLSQDPLKQSKLENARLTGILNALTKIEAMPEVERRTILGRVGRLELPFSSSGATAATIAWIQASVIRLGLEWGGATDTDAFTPVVHPNPALRYVTACTNAGDPHAMIGNEGRYQSVDAALSTNANLNHLNAAYNRELTLRVSPSVEVQADVVPAPQVAAPIAAPIADMSEGETILKHVIQGARSLGISRGNWLTITEGIGLGISKYSGNCSLATAAYQIELVDNGLVILDKKNNFSPITNPLQREALFASLAIAIPEPIKRNEAVAPILPTESAAAGPVPRAESRLPALLLALINHYEQQQKFDICAPLENLNRYINKKIFAGAMSTDLEITLLAMIRDVCDMSLSSANASPTQSSGLFAQPRSALMSDFYSIAQQFPELEASIQAGQDRHFDPTLMSNQEMIEILASSVVHNRPASGGP